MTLTRTVALASMERARRLVEQRVRPDAVFDGWDGKEVLCHLGAYARLVGALLRAAAESREPTIAELYGRQLTEEELALAGLDEVNEAIRREYAALSYDAALDFWRALHAQVIAQAARLTDDRLAAPGPAFPPMWSRPHLADVVTALIEHYEGHMKAGPRQ